MRLAWEPSDHFHPSAGLAKGAFDQVGVPDPFPVLGWEPKKRCEGVTVVLDASHCSGKRLVVPSAEGVDAALGFIDCWLAWIGVDVVEQTSELGLDGVLVGLENLGENVAGSMKRAR